MLALLRELATPPQHVAVLVPLDAVGAWPDGVTGVEVVRSPRLEASMAVTTSSAGRGWHTLRGASRCAQIADLEEADSGSHGLDHLLLVAAGASVADVAATGDASAVDDEVLRRHGVMSLDEAIAVLGLWMRWHSRPVMLGGSWELVDTTSWTTYWYAVRAALPSAWQYVGSCMEAERNGLDVSASWRCQRSFGSTVLFVHETQSTGLPGERTGMMQRRSCSTTWTRSC
jgi:hypothetical protein